MRDHNFKTYDADGSAGVKLRVTEVGSGFPILLVHGTSVDSSRWFALMERLSADFRLIAYDRRGRRRSRDAAEYSLREEGRDLARVANAIGQPFAILGHSYGALCTLMAMPALVAPFAAVLYEPPTTGRSSEVPKVVEHLEALLAEGSSEQVISRFFSDHIQLPPAALAAMQRQPTWQNRVAAAHTLPRELRAAADFCLEDVALELPAGGMLLLEGSLSPELARAGVACVAGRLPGAQVLTFEGEQHMAMDTAPEHFDLAITRFAREAQVRLSGRTSSC